MRTMTGNARAPKLGRNSLIVLLVTAGILLIPAVAMQFTAEVSWGPGDFVVAGILLAGTGLAYVFGSQAMQTPRSRALLGGLLLLGLLTVWAELAVGIFH